MGAIEPRYQPIGRKRPLCRDAPVPVGARLRAIDLSAPNNRPQAASYINRECLGLIGPNGAGNSSLLKMLNGLVKPG